MLGRSHAQGRSVIDSTCVRAQSTQYARVLSLAVTLAMLPRRRHPFEKKRIKYSRFKKVVSLRWGGGLVRPRRNFCAGFCASFLCLFVRTDPAHFHTSFACSEPNTGFRTPKSGRMQAFRSSTNDFDRIATAKEAGLAWFSVIRSFRTSLCTARGSDMVSFQTKIFVRTLCTHKGPEAKLRAKAQWAPPSRFGDSRKPRTSDLRPWHGPNLKTEAEYGASRDVSQTD